MQAIKTKYLGPTNSRGSRIKAECMAGSITIPYPYGENEEEAHRTACDALCEKLDDKIRKQYGSKESVWTKPKVGGALPNNEGYAFCFVRQ